MQISVIRPSLVYGAGAKGHLALMRNGIQQGWFPSLPETRNHRSMIHVDDLVKTLILVAEDKRANGEVLKPPTVCLTHPEISTKQSAAQ